ncbi:hypothetical protein EVAR_20945_1 [Eumeta japonica]|uniref:Uncharacterized protein n=1 Tax=Eumeta variegata TaxID=151549 RepID=A0A4C1UVH9_EUMVA|nr:hypothetical protein EVAR_20945_1 [Eumeta japonica]
MLYPSIRPEKSACDSQIVASRGRSAPIVVVANKTDVPARAVRRELAEAVAALRWRCGYVECSAKQNVNIVEVSSV